MYLGKRSRYNDLANNIKLTPGFGTMAMVVTQCDNSKFLNCIKDKCNSRHWKLSETERAADEGNGSVWEATSKCECEREYCLISSRLHIGESDYSYNEAYFMYAIMSNLPERPLHTAPVHSVILYGGPRSVRQPHSGHNLLYNSQSFAIEMEFFCFLWKETSGCNTASGLSVTVLIFKLFCIKYSYWRHHGARQYDISCCNNTSHWENRTRQPFLNSLSLFKDITYVLPHKVRDLAQWNAFHSLMR